MHSQGSFRQALTIAAILIVLSSASAVEASTIHVSPSGNDASDGRDWATAKQTVTAGLAAAASGDQVWVAAGTYVGRITLKDGVELYGGFAGTEAELAQRNLLASVTILDANGVGSVVTSPPGATSSTRIDGFTIRNGRGTSSNSTRLGGGIYCRASSPWISHNKITGNTASTGGGIYCFSSSPEIVNNTIIGNYATQGAGVYCESSSPNIINNTITGNNTNGDGGGIYCSASSPTIVNNTVAFNSSGLFSSGGLPALRHNCVWNPAGTDYSGLTAGTGDITVDPKLPHVSHGEVHLQASSPCIDAGDDTVVQSAWVDMDGQTRIEGAHVDIGADEFSVTAPSFTPRVVRVRPSGSDANDGSTWSLAKRTVQSGIDAAASLGGGEVWVVAGVYAERITLRTWVHAYGGFAGVESSRDQRDWAVNVTILDGGAGGSVVSATAPGQGSSTADGFTIRNGTGTGSEEYRSGGGVFCSGSSPIISNNKIIGNSARYQGGGLYCMYSCALISNNWIAANSAMTGGGVYCECSSPVIHNNTVVGNSGNSAGGIFSTSGFSVSGFSSPTILNNIVAFNSSGISKAGHGTPTLRNNCVYNPVGFNYSGLVAGAGDICVDPQLLAPEHVKLHLMASSPCIDAGLNEVVQSGALDIDTGTRIEGARVDIGADEFNGTVLPFAPKVIRVRPSGDDGRDGSTWGLAKRTVQAGIEAIANPAGGEVWVAAGTYNERITLKLCTHVYGGFAGTEVSRADRKPLANTTVLDGGANGSVVTCSAPGCGSSTLEGFTVRNGSGALVLSSRYGGGIYCSYSSPQISNNMITANATSSGPGGGIYCNYSFPLIDNNTVNDNVANGAAGGGIYCYYSSPMISNNRIKSNATTGSYGGGIYCLGSSPTIRRNTITENRNGGIYCGTGSSPVITNNTISKNSINGGSGGGIHCESFSASPIISNNTISGNTAGYGGGIYCSASSPFISNNTITGNSAKSGGGVGGYSFSSLIVNNVVAFNASGILNEGTTQTPTLRNNCVYNPAGPNYSGVIAGTTDILADPQLVAVNYGEVHLSPGSPCIGAGDDSAAQSEGTDMDGEARVQGAHVDIGADEFNGTVPAFTPRIVRVTPWGNDADDGLSWASAKRTVQAGIEAVAQGGGGEVWVTAGTYGERIRLKAWVHVFGGFSGTESGRDQRNWAVNETILDGAAGGSVVSASLLGYRSSTIDGFTIRNGTGSLTDNSGAGIYCYYASPSIANNTITGNNAKSGGGGIYCDSSSPLISHNTINNNSGSYGSGGGVYCKGSSPVISHNLISGNTAGSGGGVLCSSSSSTLIANNAICGNHARNGGGGIHGAAVIVNNTITGNSAGEIDISGSGGGVNGGAVISNNTIVGNTATGSGGGITYPSAAVISNNIVAFNSSGLYGSGVATLRRNCVYNPGGTNYSSGIPGSTDISVDPRLLGAGYGEVHLETASPCVDAGDDAILEPDWTDMDGQARVQGEHVDIGADEFAGAAPPFVPAILRVSSTGHDANDGSSWASSKLTVQAGIDAAALAGGGEVWVAAGTYIERINLKRFVHAYGGFAGTENSLDQRNFLNNLTVLDGGAGGSVVTATLLSPGCSTIDGFTIRNGTGTPSGNYVLGGGICCLYSSVTITNNIITANTAGGSGGRGGGIYCYALPPAISDNIIAANTSRDGGGIYCHSSNPSIVNNTISENSSSGRGAGVNCEYSSPAITDNLITGNTATSAGGGINFYSNAPAISKNTISDNAGSSGGGIACSYADSAVISGNTITGNRARTGVGGGIYFYDSSSTIVNNLVLANAAGSSGGAIACESYASPVISNNTISKNTAASSAGGIYCYWFSAPKIFSNIVAFNSSGLSNGASGTPALRNNCIYNPAGANYTGLIAGVGDISVDPLFVSIESDDYHLRRGSPCIDAGHAAGVPGGTLTDLDGQTRRLDDPSTPDCRWSPVDCGTAPVVDIGAYEFLFVMPGDFDQDGDVDQEDFGHLQECLGDFVNTPVCANADLDQDLVIGDSDFTAFQLCMSGANHSANPGCVNLVP